MSTRVREKRQEEVETVEETEELVEEQSVEEAVVEGLLAGWKFFAPKHELTRELLLLNDELGDAYFEEEYDRLPVEGVPKGRNRRGSRALGRGLEKLARSGGGGDEEEPIEDGNWFRWLYQQASGILFHGDEGAARRREQTDDESVEFFRAYVSERVFNHLAMLARSRHARKGGSFSIRNELMREIAEKIGLGLYLHEKTAPQLRSQGEEFLLRLAGEFQQWLVKEQRGVFVTTWGGIHVPNKKLFDLPDGYDTLMLTPDVWADEARAARSQGAQAARS